MAKDLTISRLDRQNILNNDLAAEEIQIKAGFKGVIWSGKGYITRDAAKGDFAKGINVLSKIHQIGLERRIQTKN